MPFSKKLKLLFLSCLLITTNTALAELTVHDDTGRTVQLTAPAQRIVSLAPHITELLFAAGAGGQVVGVVSYSDYPESARKLPQVGGYHNIDLEAVAALKSDLVVAWGSGNRHAHLDKLEALGIPVYINEPRTLNDIANSLEVLGVLAGTGETASVATEAFRTRLRALSERYSGQAPVRVFYQVWNTPLTTINGQHLISDVIRLCGGQNVFSTLAQLAPTVGTESVLAANPEAIVASGMGEGRPEWLDRWKEWPKLQAVQTGNLFFIPPDLLQRHTPRILDGATQLCEFLDMARSKRSAENRP